MQQTKFKRKQQAITCLLPSGGSSFKSGQNSKENSKYEASKDREKQEKQMQQTKFKRKQQAITCLLPSGGSSFKSGQNSKENSKPEKAERREGARLSGYKIQKKIARSGWQSSPLPHSSRRACKIQKKIASNRSFIFQYCNIRRKRMAGASLGTRCLKQQTQYSSII